MQNVIRYNGLRNVLLKDDVGALEFDISARRNILEDQLYTMNEYIEILIKRSILENKRPDTFSPIILSCSAMYL